MKLILMAFITCQMNVVHQKSNGPVKQIEIRLEAQSTKWHWSFCKLVAVSTSLSLTTATPLHLTHLVHILRDAEGKALYGYKVFLVWLHVYVSDPVW